MMFLLDRLVKQSLQVVSEVRSVLPLQSVTILLEVKRQKLELGVYI